MSDIVERLRAWVYTDSQYATAREAADEIDRLNELREQDGRAMGLLIEGYNKMKTLCVDGKYLTDEEREAVESLLSFATCNGVVHLRDSQLAAARELLERLGGER